MRTLRIHLLDQFGRVTACSTARLAPEDDLDALSRDLASAASGFEIWEAEQLVLRLMENEPWE